MDRHSALSRFRICVQFLLVFCIAAALLGMGVKPVQAGTRVDLVGPAGSGRFGAEVLALSNGNLVITDPQYSSGGVSNIGAVYLYDGKTKAMISQLTGSQANDGQGIHITQLSNGNFLIAFPYWSTSRGAVTWCSGTAGCEGAISATNSLVGGAALDGIGDVQLLSNGNYVVVSLLTDGSAPDVGSATWCSGTIGCSGIVTTANSLLGTVSSRISQIIELRNGNYVVKGNSSSTWCSGGGACVGTVSAANSLMGSPITMITVLPNGHYLVSSSNWANGSATNAGAVTWCDGATGCIGAISPSNSLVGEHTNDLLGNVPIRVLSNGNFVVIDPDWTNGTATSAGAVTWCSGTTGCHGAVSESNSLVGHQTDDRVGSYGIYEVGDSNYVVNSPFWANGSDGSAGAVTWCSGTAGCQGAISAANSLVGVHDSNEVGVGGVARLTGGDYVVASPYWGDGVKINLGAVTRCSGSAGCIGSISAGNSLVGSHDQDQVGISHLKALPNGSYVVASANWKNGSASGAGAITWCSASSPCTGPVTTGNSLVGSHTNDLVGKNDAWIKVLQNGNYVIRSVNWANSSTANAGAMTWCNGTTGCQGAISAANSLVGSHSNDFVAMDVSEFPSGKFLALSPFWDNGSAPDAGAATLCSGTGACSGTITASNSLVGTRANDQVGNAADELQNGIYLVESPYWTNGSAAGAGAVTWCREDAPCKGTISASNSLVGTHASELLTAFILNNGNYLVRSNWTNGNIAGTGAVTFCRRDLGCKGTITAGNSLVGSHTNDFVGKDQIGDLGNGFYILLSRTWDNGTLPNAGAVTWVSDQYGLPAGPVSAANSVVGNAQDTTGADMYWLFDPVNQQLVVALPHENRVVVVQPSISFTYLPLTMR